MTFTSRAVAAIAVGCSVAAFALPATATAAPGRSILADSQPGWATPRALRSHLAGTEPVHARVYLPWRNRTELARISRAVSTPGTSAYGRHLSPAQFRSAFSPTSESVAAVQKWLRGAGLRVVDVPADRQYVAVEGSAAAATRAFHTTFATYTAFGRVLRAAVSAPSVPAALAGTVSAVVGLDDGSEVDPAAGTDTEPPSGTSPAKVADPSVGFRAGTPCSTYWGEKTVTLPTAVGGSTTKPLAPCGYTPAQVRGLYGLGTADTGAGQTVAFVGANASPTIAADLTQYSRLHNLPDPQIQQIVPPGVYQHPTTPKNDPSAFFGEQTLDAEAIHTTAPAAKLLYVASSNARQDFDRSVKAIVDKHLAPIISISYGFSGESVPQGFVNSLNNIFIEAVATGIGVFVSTGDDGDEVGTLNKTSVDFYANIPNITAVGGTSAAIVKGAGGSVFTTAGAPASIPALSSAAKGGPYGIDDPANPVNQPGWTRAFEVGWQTGRVSATGTLTPLPADTSVPAATTYTFTGSIDSAPAVFGGGGGGGISTVFPQPSYQKGITDSAKDGTSGAPGTSGRSLPDIAALADPNTGLLVGQTQKFTDGTYYDEYRIGGTSLAAPLMAGMAAVANQKAGKDLGFLNPRIYAAYRQASSTIYDVDEADLNSAAEFGSTPAVFRVNFTDSESATGGRGYSVRLLESPLQSLQSVRGYDTATGVGSPKDSTFLTALGTVTPLSYTPDPKSPNVG
ncbi:protease pro-enzyme activation domain-containing protein [Williamsia sp. CHRR-6]|uniref:S53 family peptidase n=1 Tax=Williamsia sp. CHRR-6 TaxID=2835871 RepID=UPI001BD96073|nr:S53 family peptidase [Williamsia sp. CHRR-6]MBT0565458.1 S53 family peptidase [Williamsia sp. CHRR-6]